MSVSGCKGVQADPSPNGQTSRKASSAEMRLDAPSRISYEVSRETTTSTIGVSPFPFVVRRRELTSFNHKVFAFNLGMPYLEPQEVFEGQQGQNDWEMKKWDPKAYDHGGELSSSSSSGGRANLSSCPPPQYRSSFPRARHSSLVPPRTTRSSLPRWSSSSALLRAARPSSTSDTSSQRDTS